MNGIIKMIKGLKVLANPEEFISQVQLIFPDIVLIVLLSLVILRYIGFEGASKYIALTLVIALLVALV